MKPQEVVHVEYVLTAFSLQEIHDTSNILTSIECGKRLLSQGNLKKHNVLQHAENVKNIQKK